VSGNLEERSFIWMAVTIASSLPPAPFEDGTRTGRPGVATLRRVDDLKARAAYADQDRRARLNKRLRRAILEGAEEDSRRRLGRGQTVEDGQAGVVWPLPRPQRPWRLRQG